jgi:TatD DNase family protein
MLIDIHTHKREEGVLSLLSQRVVTGAEQEPDQPFSAGIHPWDAAVAQIDCALAYLRRCNSAAIGETGLDFACEVEHGVQQSVFEAQLGIAVERGLPVIIHCVRAYNNVLDTLDRLRPKSVIMHGFIGSKELAQRIIGRGYHLSFGPRAINSPKTLEAFAIAPLDLIFAETDDSEVGIREVYQQLAAAKNISIDKLIREIESNYNRLFR